MQELSLPIPLHIDILLFKWSMNTFHSPLIKQNLPKSRVLSTVCFVSSVSLNFARLIADCLKDQLCIDNMELSFSSPSGTCRRHGSLASRPGRLFRSFPVSLNVLLWITSAWPFAVRFAFSVDDPGQYVVLSRPAGSCETFWPCSNY